MNEKQHRRWYDGYIFWGMVFGFLTAAGARLWTSSKSGDDVRSNIRDRIEPGHVMDESMAEGKAAARRLQTPGED